METDDHLEVHYVCKKYREPFPTGTSIKFCQNCGARVSSISESDVKDTRPQPLAMLVDDSAVARHKVASLLRSLKCELLEATGEPEALSM